ncbi:MAG: glutathione S-transferase N-terminal domain-containing protein [Candidatus Binatia bacterium]
MKLYYAPGACSLATHIVLEWIGRPYEIHKVDIHGTKSPELLERNPEGAVPVIEEDGWVLTQNSAILNYLADTNPQAQLGGDGTPKSRAEVNRWLGFVNSDVHPAYKPLFGATAYLGDPSAIEKSKEDAKTRLRTRFEHANGALQGRDWVAGARSVADAYLYVMLRWAKAQKIDLSGLGNLERFFQRMSSDPAVQKVLKEEARG